VIGQRTYRTAHSELLCGSTKPEIVDRKRIRVSQSAHRDHLGRPRTDTGQGEQPVPGPLPIAPRPQFDIPGGDRLDQPAETVPPCGGQREMLRYDIGEPGDAREQVSQIAARILDRLAVGGDEPPNMGTRGLHRHLLPQQHPDGQFGPVNCPRNALARRLGDQCAQVRIRPEMLDHRFGIGVEIEQAPAPGDRRGEVTEVGQRELTPDMVGLRRERHDPPAPRQPQGTAVGAVADLLDAGHRAGAEMAEHSVMGERRSRRKPQAQRARQARSAVPPRPGPGAQTCRGHVEHGADGVVELPDAGEPGSERHLTERQVGGLDEDPCRLSALRPCQCQRPGADLGLQNAFELPGGVAQAGRQAGHPVTVHGAVRDQPHRPCHHVTAHIPLRRTG